MPTNLSPNWDLALLQLFFKVAKEGSLTRAAVALGKPQSMISRQIARLEQECGGHLFLRTGRGVSLSPLGERLMPHIEALLDHTKILSDELNHDRQGLRGDVCIGAMPSLCLPVIVPLFKSLYRDCPGIRLRVLEGSAGQIDQWLLNGTVDIGLTYRYRNMNSPDIERLAAVSSYLVGPANDAVTSSPTVRFEQLRGLPLVLPGLPSSMRFLLDQLAKKDKFSLNLIMEADSTQILKAVVAAESCYTVLPLHAVAQEVEFGSLQASHIIEPKIDRILAMGVTSARSGTQVTREVARAIRLAVQKKRHLMHEVL